MIRKGFQFGMLLQIAVGPICIFIFQAAANYGFTEALLGVLGVTLVDGLYILAAILGLGAIINKYSGSKLILKYFGAIILFLFGLSNISGAFDRNLLPSLHFSGNNDNSIFVKTLLLTLSNPLTIIFWAGVFSSKIAEGDKKNSEIYAFGFGAILSTLVFLTFIALLGSIIQSFISPKVSDMLNIFVGGLLLFFAIRTIIKNH